LAKYPRKFRTSVSVVSSNPHSTGSLSTKQNGKSIMQTSLPLNAADLNFEYTYFSNSNPMVKKTQQRCEKAQQKIYSGRGLSYHAIRFLPNPFQLKIGLLGFTIDHPP
jgi:hypothetical protein